MLYNDNKTFLNHSALLLIVRSCFNSDMVSGADLNVLTSRKIRQHLEEKYELDMGVRKEEIDEIVLITIKQLQRERAGNASRGNLYLSLNHLQFSIG